MDFAKRRRELYTVLNDRGIESYHTAHGPNMRYLTGFNGSVADLALTDDGEAVLIVDPRYDHYARELPGEDLSVICYDSSATKALRDALGERSIDAIHLERPNLSYNQFLSLKQTLAVEDRTYGPDLVLQQRAQKRSDEIDAIQTAIDKTLPVFDRIDEHIEPGQSERDISRFIRSELNSRGEEHAFDPLVLIGERTANPHCPASDRELQEDDALLVDMGVRIDGYCSDLTRMFFVGEPDPEIKAMHELSQKAAQRALSVLEPGAVPEKVQGEAHEVIEKTDYKTKHSLGHGVGLELHEDPKLTSSNSTGLQPGNIVTVEPGAYQDGTGGGRVEYMVLIEDDGIRRLDE